MSSLPIPALCIVFLLSVAPASASANRAAQHRTATPTKTQPKKSSVRAKFSTVKTKLGATARRLGTTLRFKKAATQPTAKLTPSPVAKPAAATNNANTFHEQLSVAARPLAIISKKIAKEGSESIRRAHAVKSGDRIFLLNVSGGNGRPLEHYQVAANKEGMKALHTMLSSAGLSRGQRQQWIRANLGQKKKSEPLTESDWRAGAIAKVLRVPEAKPGATLPLQNSNIRLSPGFGGSIGISSPGAATGLPQGNEVAVLSRVIERHGISATRSRQIAETKIAEVRTSGSAVSVSP